MNYAKILSTWWSGNCYHDEQLQAIINSPDVRAYAWILHDKCKNDDGNGLKKPHFHFLLRFNKNQRGSWFKSFATEDMGIVFAEPTRDPENLFNYLIHDTEKCRNAGDYLYDPSERMSTITDFGGNEKENENEELCNDLFDLLDKKITWHELIKRKPKRIYSISNISKAHELLSYERSSINYLELSQRLQQKPAPKTNEMRKLTPEEAGELPW